MQDLSKTEIQVDDDTKLVVPNEDQIKELIETFQKPENLDFVGKFPDWPHDPNLESRVEQWLERSKDGSFVPLIALYKGQLAGTFRLIDINYKHERVEFGYILLPQFTKKGIASSCIKAMLGFSFDKLGMNRVELLIDSRNEDSIRLAKRLNYTYEGTMRQDYKYEYSQPGKYSDGMVFSMLKSEYKP